MKILIIGGMGPQASLLLHQRIIDRSVERGAVKGSDFPEIIHLSLPVNDFISSQKSIDEAAVKISQAASTLGDHDLSQVIIACNTAHLLTDKLPKEIASKLLPLTNATRKKIVKERVKCVGLVASPTTIGSDLYSEKRLGVPVVTLSPSEQVETETMIRSVIAGQSVPLKRLKEQTDKLLARGADIIILGCTELSVIARDGLDRTIDPLRLVVEDIFR